MTDAQLAVIADWLASRADVAQSRYDGRWVATLSVEMFSHDERDAAGSRAVTVTHTGLGDTRDAALVSLARNVDQLAVVHRGHVHAVRGLGHTEAGRG